MSVLLFIFIICPSIVFSQDPRRSAKRYCHVQSPNDLSIFNLTTIQHNDIDSTVRINEFEHLRVHFCGPLKDPCNGKLNYAVCLHTKDKEIGVGKEPPKVAIEFGKIMFRYVGDKCNKTHKYTVDVEMKCNFANKEKLTPDLDIVYNHDQCSFKKSIETIAACSTRKQAKCDLSDKTGYYNFSPLTNLGRNYVITLSNSVSVILNVCHSLLYGHHSHQCDHNTMVCLVDETNTKEPSYTRLGNLNDDMHFSAYTGSVHLDLTSDTPCNKEDDTRLKTIRTTIEFVCRMNVTNKWPEYISGFGTCHYKFRWLTPAACGEHVLIKQSNLQHQPCRVGDPFFGFYYDFSTLEGNVAFVNSSDKKAEYQISICAPLQKSNCTKSGTGVCKYIKDNNITVSKGLANNKLMWKKNQIFLNYTDGIACGNNRRSYTTIIFQCSRTNNTLLVDDHDPCATIVTWTSSMVCKSTYEVKRLLEVLELENFFHWKLLRRHNSNYVVQGKSNATQYHLNVDIPLVEDQFTNCTNGTGVCKVVVDNEGRRISELNLGSQDSDTQVKKDGDMYLKYLNGSICEEDKSKRISTKITFTCDVEAYAVRRIYRKQERLPPIEFFLRLLRIVQGTPTFKRYNNCEYEFDWRTTYACSGNDAEMSVGCRTKKNTVELFNFTYLIENSLFNVNNNESSGYFSARNCKDKNKCNGTFVCDNWPYYRKDLKNKLDFTKPLVAFKFANESQCKSDTYYNSVIKIWCGLWAGIGESFLLKEEECSIGLDWDKYINACHLDERFTGGKKETYITNILNERIEFIEKASLGFLITFVVVLVLLALGILYCYRHKIRRLLRRNTRGNYAKNIWYIVMGDSEPIVDLSLELERQVDPNMEPEPEVDLNMESEPEVDLDMESTSEDVDIE